MADKEELHIFGDGCVHGEDTNLTVAVNFINKYPLTKFMDGRQIDYSDFLIKPDVDVNVCMVGSGKPNNQIFLSSVVNNQFLTKINGKIVLKKVNYHIFDKSYAEEEGGINHSYNAFLNGSFDKNDYLPLPDLPANEQYYDIDIQNPDFYNKIYDIVSANENDANFIIVSFESEARNFDFTQKLVAKRSEWGIDNLVIFVPQPNSRFDEKCVYFFGNEDGFDDILKMAKMRNEIYDLEYKITVDGSLIADGNFMRESQLNAQKNWYISKSELERRSSLYSCLSLQSKLNLMGLEYCKSGANDLPALTESEYFDIYAKDDRPDTETYNLTVRGKKVIKYSLNYPKSGRKNMAISEHLRWNAFMIMSGFIPASKEQILNEKAEKDGQIKYTNGKNYSLKRHGNLTTFDGLVTFAQMLAVRNGGNEEDCDVIKYDYQLMDDAYWLLTENGFKIVKKS